MKCQALLLTLLMVCSLCVVGYIHNQKKEEAQLSKLISFQNVKHRVTKDVMQEYQTHLIESSSLLDKIKKQIQDLAGEVRGAQDVAEGTKNEVDMCNSDLKRIADEAVATEADKTHVKSEFEKKKASFQEQLANLKKEMEQLSKVCDYIKKTSDEAKKLCSIMEESPNKEEKKEEAKPEAPKEEAKPEAPKEEAKPEAPKEEAKPEAPKEEAKPEAPKEAA